MNPINDESSQREIRAREDLSTSDLAGSGERSRLGSLLQPDEVPAERRATIITPAPVTSAAATPSPVGASATAGGAAANAPARDRQKEEDRGPLFSSDETRDLRMHWDDVQAGFVDEPRKAVESADRLVGVTMKRLAEIFADERQRMELQWESGDNVSTEDLRIALRRYRSFFGRLLTV